MDNYVDFKKKGKKELGISEDLTYINTEDRMNDFSDK
jgi:hypothetical protein|tara:strand:- start:718 stop:828 length:111 start_codon:yes stop_codon:yes gene_type:complete